jgi:hypothetical protein
MPKKSAKRPVQCEQCQQPLSERDSYLWGSLCTPCRDQWLRENAPGDKPTIRMFSTPAHVQPKAKPT